MLPWTIDSGSNPKGDATKNDIQCRNRLAFTHLV